VNNSQIEISILRLLHPEKEYSYMTHRIALNKYNLCRSLVNVLFFQALKFLVESFDLLNDLFPLPSILDAGFPVFDLYLADILFDVILPSVLGSSL
jgi:hypothetical protein